MKVPRFIRKRLTTFIITGILVPVLVNMGVPEDVIQWIVGLAMTYIAGQSISDAAYAFRNQKEEAGEPPLPQKP